MKTKATSLVSGQPFPPPVLVEFPVISSFRYGRRHHVAALRDFMGPLIVILSTRYHESYDQKDRRPRREIQLELGPTKRMDGSKTTATLFYFICPDQFTVTLFAANQLKLNLRVWTSLCMVK